MPKFSQASCDRISRVVQRFEADFADNTGPDGGHVGVSQPWLQWYELTTAFDPTTHEADAHPVRWLAPANSGNGEYTADTSVTRTVRDTTQQSGAGVGDWVLCRPIGSTNGTVWEVVGLPAGRKRVKLDALWTATSETDGSATASVWSWDSGSSAWTDSGDNLTIYMPPWLTSWVLPAGTWLEVEFDADSQSWIVVEPIIEVRGVLDGTLNFGSSATVSIWAGGSDTTANLTGYAPATLSSGSIASTKHVRMKWDRVALHWEVVSAEC